jgi:hypothetical protein
MFGNEIVGPFEIRKGFQMVVRFKNTIKLDRFRLKFLCHLMLIKVWASGTIQKLDRNYKMCQVFQWSGILVPCSK